MGTGGISSMFSLLNPKPQAKGVGKSGAAYLAMKEPTKNKKPYINSIFGQQQTHNTSIV